MYLLWQATAPSYPEFANKPYTFLKAAELKTFLLMIYIFRFDKVRPPDAKLYPTMHR